MLPVLGRSGALDILAGCLFSGGYRVANRAPPEQLTDAYAG